MKRPPSIQLFALMYLFACGIALLLVWAAAQTSDYGLRMTPEAAAMLTDRIMWIRLAGIGLALSLLAMIVIGRSRSARGALALRWLLSLLTSPPFLVGIGLSLPGAHMAWAAVGLSITQLLVEGAAILLLFGEDAGEWFESRPAHR